MAAFDVDHLRLTDFMDLPTLQEIQDSFAAVANVKATITDADGNLLTQPNPTKDFLNRQRTIEAAEETQQDGPQKEGREYVAPIMVDGHRLGTIRMTASASGAAAMLDDTKLVSMAEKLGLDTRQVRTLVAQILKARNTRPAAIQFLFLLANAIARLCYQEFQLRQRVDELTTVYNVTMLLADSRDLQQVLQRTVELVTQVMGAKAASLRLIDQENDELIVKATFNLSADYLNKGPIRLSKAEIDRIALSPKGYEYVHNMATDPRIQYPQESQREGVISMLSAGMRYKGKAIGALRVYTDQEQVFPQIKIDLMKAIASQAAAAIENTRLLQESIEAERLEKQVAMAADVQQRMIPQSPPKVPGVDLASVYIPCYELGGDFFDFMPLPDDNLGLVVADVSGKGVPASLIMASVRAYLRAEVDSIYYLYEIMKRVNLMLVRDTKPSEFVTLLYGVLDARNLRLTYCNAGHPPGLLLRDGNVSELDSPNMVLGIDPDQEYRQSVLHLRRGDTLLLYTDGLADAMNFQSETFGRQRIVTAFSKGGASAEVIAQNILWDLRRFVGLTKRTDDVTMIVARFE
ncbi:MAG TPA: SpoIIE family protein phosphatase [Tepidisphaeraceae bacterium]|jgi:serine phosphatase RsbU (regulator of sigma subunit)|nr:SpoIIE family protein phosphatase [Tepidisphaeraceae bacterium]